MKDWADVWVSDSSERMALELRALFFIPDAKERCAALGHNQASLLAHARYLKSTGRVSEQYFAGRAAIGNVLECVPVVYKSALGFINIVNAASGGSGDPPFRKSDIVACVFRLRDAPEVAEKLSLTAADLSRECALKKEIAQSALERFRLSYVDAESIRRLFIEVKKKNNVEDKHLNDILNSDPSSIIKTDVRKGLSVSIKRVGHHADGVDYEEYVYNKGEDLVRAPTEGHVWAIKA